MSRDQAAYDALVEHVEPAIVIDRCCAELALAAADAHDLAHGIHRITLDDGTVERAARKLDSEAWNERAFLFVAHSQSPDEVRAYRQAVAKAQARNILAAAVQEERA
jgi:hypothetical protein